ncbi:MAG: coproporphyrinogen III oxidase family protein [Gemmatimonadetes bacterium]|nr:coproporphyrinogen III oxidase family protein [Gemmatimonadota bacterium]
MAARLNTLYVGGGTPSLLGPIAMPGLRGIVGDERLRDADLEWSAEANPESFTAAVAREWRQAGVTRLSLGIQSFHPPALRWMARLHGPSESEEAVRVARAAGLENINVDLIFGLPGHLGRSWSQDLDRVLSLEPTHISLYGLSVEPGTPLQRAIDAGRESPIDDVLYRDEYLLAAERLTGAGYRHYEVSNFARPGFESRHNRNYWSGSAYLGLGNGAHSYLPPLRRWNLRDWIAYRDLAVRGDLPLGGEERIEGGTLRLERIWLGLRTAEGLSATTLAALGGRLEPFRDKAAEWIRAGWALPHAAVPYVGTPGPLPHATIRCVRTPGAVWEQEDDRLRLSAEGWLLLDQLAVELDTAIVAA